MIDYQTYTREILFTKKGEEVVIKFHYFDYSWGAFFTGLTYPNDKNKDKEYPYYLPTTIACFSAMIYGLFFALIICIILFVQSFVDGEYLGTFFYLLLAVLSVMSTRLISKFSESKAIKTLEGSGWILTNLPKSTRILSR